MDVEHILLTAKAQSIAPFFFLSRHVHATDVNLTESHTGVHGNGTRFDFCFCNIGGLKKSRCCIQRFVRIVEIINR